MPFAPVKQAPLALLQLQAAVHRALGDAVSARIVYPSHDFANALGLDVYHQIAYADSDLRPGEMSGLGDWFFRQIAFPDLPDNTEAYRRRYFAQGGGLVDIDAVLAGRRTAADLLRDLIRKYALDDADLVGFTSMFAQHAACIATARILKERGDPPAVVIGGANCEGPMGRALADCVPCFDAVFSGPALKSFPEYVRGQIGGNTLPVRGVFVPHAPIHRRLTLRVHDAVAVAPASAVDHDSLGEELEIDTPLALDYGGFLDAFERAFGNTLEPVLTFETSRGCWWGAKAHCPFCGLNGSTMAFRAMTPARALATFDTLFRHAPRCRVFECVDNIMPADYPASVFPRLTPPPSTVIYYEVKADLTASDLASMAAANVRLVQPGIEALSTPSLKALRKGTNACGNVLFLKNCLANGVIPVWNLLIGVPREDRPEQVYAKYAADIPAMRHLAPPWAVFKVRIDRFSPYFTRPDEYGLRLKPKNFYTFVYPFADDVLFDLAYYFDDANAPFAEYAAAAAKWHPILNELVRGWFAAWHVNDPARRPALFIEERDGTYFLHDSRSGSAIDITIGTFVALAARYASVPMKIGELVHRLDEAGCDDPSAILAELRELRLLFEEDDRIVSLAHIGSRPLCPPPVGGI
jgi:ribosomal peptide maturation radical SAM protein 1